MNNSEKANTINRAIRLSIIFAILALLALLIGLLAVTQPARASGYVVTNSNDSGEGSLRRAITDANKNLGPDTITFSDKTDGIPIILAGAAGEDANGSGDLDILNGGDLTITGNGAADTIIDGGAIDRVFHICPVVPPGGCTNTVTFTGVTIRNGSNVDHGGGIYNASGTTIMDSSTIISNTVRSSGGGIYNLSDTMTLNNSTVSANEADYGGGIYLYAGTTTVDNSIVSANEAIDGGGIYSLATLYVQNGSAIGGNGASNFAINGGGIFMDDGTTTVDNSSVSENLATSFGGGIYSKATLNVQNGSTIGGIGRGNVALFDGGGIYVYHGTTTVDSSVVSDNAANDAGGGIWNQGLLIVKNGSTIGVDGAGNWAEDEGGGIFNGYVGTTTVNDSAISYNDVEFYGAGISNAGTVMVTASIILTNSAAASGGGILNYGSMTLNGSTVGDNWAERGGGIYHFSETMTLNNSIISDNFAVSEGGGIYSEGTLLVQNGSTIGGNSTNDATDAFGGGIFVKSGTTTVDSSTVSANEAGLGGGIYNDYGTTTVKDSNISANNTKYSGAGILNSRGTLLVQQGSVVSSNTAGVHGGGIYNSTGTITVDDSDIRDNKATKEGGGISNGAGTITVTNSLIQNNMADTDGGGIYNYPGTTIVTGSRILNNTAAIEGGGVINKANSVGATSVTGSCIVGNSEKSFYNSRDAQQIATGNWWGAAGGPNTPGADTFAVDGKVNVTPWSTIPILGCAPDLQVSKANNTGGNGTVGKPFDWTITISNTGFLSATFSSGQKILIDELPSGPTYGLPVTGSFVDVANHGKILCSLADDTLTCEAKDGDVTLGPLTGSLEVTFSVKPFDPSTLVNPHANGICKVDPDGNIPENDESDNDCPENVVTISAPDLQVGKVNDTSGNGEVGTPFHWTLTVSNSGPASATFASEDTILKDNLPTGPTYGDPVIGTVANITNGDKIQCDLAADTLTCTADGEDVTLAANTGSFEVTIPVTSDASATLTNPKAGGTCKVDPDGNIPENDDSNNDCPENVVTITAPDLQVGKVNDTSGNGKVGTPFQWTLTVSNTGPASATFASGDTILKDDLPTGPTYSDLVIGNVVNVTNSDKIKCSLQDDTLTCKADGADVTFGGGNSYFDVTFSVTPDAPATLTNPKAGGTCQVDPDGKVTEGDDSNNDCPENTVDVPATLYYMYITVVIK